MAGYAELFIDQGSDYTSTITLNDSNTGLPMNLVTYTALSSIKKSVYSANVSDIFTCTVTDAANGNITMSLAASNTSLMAPGRYNFDLIITNGATKNRVLEGVVLLSPGITGLTEPGAWPSTTS